MHQTTRLSRQLSHHESSHLSPALLNFNIKAFIERGQFTKALQLFSVSPLSATQFTFPSLLKASTFLSNLTYGKTLHSTIILSGLQFDPFITTSLINMYVKCGLFSYAVNVFEKMVEREAFVKDVTSWNSLLDGYFKFGQIKEGLAHFYKMQAFGLLPDAYSLSILLGVLGFKEGQQIHGYIVRNMFKSDPFLETALIDMYSNRSRIMEAWFVFHHLKDKSNVVVWNVMIGGFLENGWWEWSIKLYSLMKGENVKFVSESFSSTLSACGYGDVVDFGRQVHCDLIKLGFENNPFVYTSLLSMYGKCQFVEDAENVFHQVLDKGIELWNAMISTFVCNKYSYAAFEVYNKMRCNLITPDSFTLSNVLSCGSMIGIYNVGRSVHAELVKRPIDSSTTVQSALLTMYCKSGSVDDANSVLRTIREMDVVAWGSMISGFCQNSKFREALDYFGRMDADGVRPDSDIMSSVISACTGLENVDSGCMIHGYVIKIGLDRDVYVGSSLVDMYSKCGFPDMAENLFSDMPHKNLVTWNLMMSCYCRNGLPDQSINLFSKIVQHGFYPDSVSITSVLAAVSSIAALLNGKIIHGYLVRLEIKSDIQLENALMDMYIKCGFLKYAEYIFQHMSQKDVVTWNCMISGYGSHGNCLQALSLFDEMKNCGIKPDDVTFLSLISSCNHAGLVDEGHNIFQCMTVEHAIEPKMEHYVNIIDLLGRAGRLEDAYNFIKTMPMEPDRSVWLSMLCASRAHSNVELGELAAQNLLKLEPDRGSNYVQLLHLYGESELWDKAANIRSTMKEKGLKKNPGCSWIELRNKVDVFFSRDSSSLKTMEMYEILHCLRRNMEKEGSDYEIELGSV
ncbi:pentatricopeptide repeat-containing protein At2g40720-like [Durio zibethinus]|uniref:Pentatricopeptide repeat-containing protein At2g40720-like n=1 Tax=Durio zibethinus TaxID=66656 RepID=A0A6P6AIY5_DURZI|nr:pentatricopeptide repeat-containing protein At2g40720-like [Durio zibethinus]